MQIKLFLCIFLLAILVQPVFAIDTNAKNATLQMTSTLENGDTQLQFNYAKNINDGRGITFGCIGFCTGTYDGNMLIKYYTTLNQSNTLAKYISSLDAIDAGPHTAAGGDGNPSLVGLSGFIADVQNCNDPLFSQAQMYVLDQFYWNPAVSMWNIIGAKNALTLAFIYDINVRHGVNGAKKIIDQASSDLGGTPKMGIDEGTFLSRMFIIRDAALERENLGDVDRDAGFKAVLASGNVDLNTPFTFTAYGDPFTINGDLGIAFATTPAKRDFPVAEFNTSIISSYAPFSVQFTDLSKNATGWNWDFGDGYTSTEQNPTHTYFSAGNYFVNLTVNNANGTASKYSTINVLENSSSNSESSSGRSSHSKSGSGGVGGSPEPQSNIEAKELLQIFITNENHVKIDFPQKATPAVYVSFDSKKTVGKTTTIAEMLKAKSTLVSGLPSDEVYKFLNIWVGNNGFSTSNNIENAVICFKVAKSWIQEKNIDQSSIMLNMYSDNKWNQLSTILSGVDDKYLYFTAKPSGFSHFTITGKIKVKEIVKEIESRPKIESLDQNNESSATAVEQRPEQKENTSTPGFDIIYGIIGLLGVFICRRRL